MFLKVNEDVEGVMVEEESAESRYWSMNFQVEGMNVIDTLPVCTCIINCQYRPVKLKCT